MRFKGKNCVVTGAARGIGRATAELLIREGAEVWCVDRDRCDHPGTTSRMHMLQLDLADRAAVRELFAILPDYVHALINNAGAIDGESVLKASDESWNTMLEVNLTNHWRLTTTLHPKFGQGAAIVNVSSVDSLFAHPQRAGYAAAKGGLNALTISLARALAPTVRVNVVLPGPIATRLTPNESAGHRTLLNRRGTAAEVASAIAFLASSDSSYITGQAIHVDGGMFP